MAKRNKQDKNQAKAPRQARPVHSVEQYISLHEQYHRELRKERYGRTHEDYGFPLLIRDGVCAAEPDMGHAAGIVIDALPKNLKGKDVLDVGCGAGVIGIAAAYRGANVIACDNSPKAIQLTQENLENNSDIQDRVTVVLSNIFDGVRGELPHQKYDFILANLWFPIARKGFEDTARQAEECYKRYFSEVRGLLKPNGVACLTSGAAANSNATMAAMSTAGITAEKAVVQKNHFGNQVAMNWYLYSFNADGQPATLRPKVHQGHPARLSGLPAYRPGQTL